MHKTPQTSIQTSHTPEPRSQLAHEQSGSRAKAAGQGWGPCSARLIAQPSRPQRKRPNQATHVHIPSASTDRSRIRAPPASPGCRTVQQKHTAAQAAAPFNKPQTTNHKPQTHKPTATQTNHKPQTTATQTNHKPQTTATQTNHKPQTTATQANHKPKPTPTAPKTNKAPAEFPTPPSNISKTHQRQHGDR